MVRGRRRTGSSGPLLEGLESRVALAMADAMADVMVDSPADAPATPGRVAAPLTVSLAVPTSGSTLTALPQSLTIAFNRPIATDPADAASQVVVALTDVSGMPTSSYFSPDLSLHAPELDDPGRLLTVWFDPQAAYRGTTSSSSWTASSSPTPTAFPSVSTTAPAARRSATSRSPHPFG